MINLFWDLDYREEITAMSLLVSYVSEHKSRMKRVSSLWWRYLSLRVLISARKWEQVADDLKALHNDTIDTPVEPWVIIDLAKMKRRAGDSVAEFQGYQRAYELAEYFKDDRCIARACGCLGNFLSQYQQYGEAIKYFEIALSIDRKRNDQTHECEQLRKLGDVQRNRKHWGISR